MILEPHDPGFTHPMIEMILEIKKLGNRLRKKNLLRILSRHGIIDDFSPSFPIVMLAIPSPRVNLH
jgi:hypothetical protein